MKTEPNAAMYAALVDAQSELKNPGFDKENGGFKGAKYASLASVRDTVMPVLAKFGLGVMQFPVSQVIEAKPYVGCRTVLFHKDGGSIEDTLLLPIDKITPQGGGSAITYARRYSLLGVLGVVADDDDDGNASSFPTATTRPVTQKAAPTEKQPPGHRAMEAVGKWSGVKDADLIALTKKIVAQLNLKIINGKMTDVQADEIVAFVDANKGNDFTKVVK